MRKYHVPLVGCKMSHSLLFSHVSFRPLPSQFYKGKITLTSELKTYSQITDGFTLIASRLPCATLLPPMTRGAWDAAHSAAITHRRAALVILITAITHKIPLKTLSYIAVPVPLLTKYTRKQTTNCIFITKNCIPLLRAKSRKITDF